MLVKCRHVVIPTLPLRNVLFWKAIFTRHPDLLKRVLGEFARIRLRFVLHRVFAGEGSGRDRNTGSFPVVLPWRWPVFHQRCSARMEITKDPVVSLSLSLYLFLSPSLAGSRVSVRPPNPTVTTKVVAQHNFCLIVRAQKVAQGHFPICKTNSQIYLLPRTEHRLTRKMF